MLVMVGQSAEGYKKQPKSAQRIRVVKFERGGRDCVALDIPQFEALNLDPPSIKLCAFEV